MAYRHALRRGEPQSGDDADGLDAALLEYIPTERAPRGRRSGVGLEEARAPRAPMHREVDCAAARRDGERQHDTLPVVVRERHGHVALPAVVARRAAREQHGVLIQQRLERDEEPARGCLGSSVSSSVSQSLQPISTSTYAVRFGIRSEPPESSCAMCVVASSWPLSNERPICALQSVASRVHSRGLWRVSLTRMCDDGGHTRMYFPGKTCRASRRPCTARAARCR